MNKYKFFMIVSIMILVISIGGTLAWYIWKSTDNTSVSLEVCAPEISFIGGTTLNGEGLVPVTDKSKGLKKQVDVYLNKTCKEGDSGVMNLYMKLDLLPDELKHETFIYEVVKDDVVLNSGNFKDKQEGETITLLTDQIITENDSIYFIYVYIDGTRDNPREMSNKGFRFTVWGEGAGAIYNEYVIPNFSDATVFLNSGIAKADIQSITIMEDNTVPEGITGIPLSSTGDDSIMLWYTQDEDTQLYDIYMGSKNGIITLNTSAKNMFSGLTNVTSLDLSRLDTSNVTNMEDMFLNCSSLTNFDISNFNTSNVTKMKLMFAHCKSLINLDLTNFNTSSARDLSYMFHGCSKLTSIDFINFDTSNVSDMRNMFNSCSSLTNLDLSHFDTSKVTDMNEMFTGCSSLIHLDVSSWDTSKVSSMMYMFAGCSSLSFFDASDWDTSKLTNAIEMFRGCSSLEKIDLSKATLTGITTFTNMFTFVPTSAEIIIKDTEREWMNTNFPNYTNLTLIPSISS